MLIIIINLKYGSRSIQTAAFLVFYRFFNKGSILSSMNFSRFPRTITN